MLKATPQTRLLTVGTAASAFVFAAGRYTRTTLAALLSAQSGELADPHTYVVAMGKVTGEAGNFKTAEVQLFGTGADNATLSARLWQVKYGALKAQTQPGDIELMYLGLLEGVLSTAVGPTGGTVVGASECIADTLTWTPATADTTPKGMFDKIAAGYQAADGQVYSPANNTPARLILPDIGNGSLLIEPIVGTATLANALVEVGV